MRFRASHSFIRRGIYGGILSALVAASISQTIFAAFNGNLSSDLTTRSPTQSYTQRTSDSSDDAANHILIYSDHGDAGAIVLGVYLPIKHYSSGVDMDIVGGSDTKCHFYEWMNNSDRTNDDKSHEISSNHNIYYINYSVVGSSDSRDLPSAGPFKYTDNRAACNGSGETKNQTVTIPASFLNNAPPDPATGNQYITVKMTISLVDSMNPASPTSNASNIPGIHDAQGSMTFSVKSEDSQALIGVVDSDRSTGANANNSLVGKQFTNNDGYIDGIYPFGLDCTNSQYTDDQRVTLYDADNGSSYQTGDNSLVFYIQQYVAVPRQKVGGRWVAAHKGWEILSRSDYSDSNISTGWNGNVTTKTITVPDSKGVEFTGLQFRPVDGQVNLQAWVKIKHMAYQNQDGGRYRLVFENLALPLHNYIYVGLPGNALFGATNFSCGSPYNLVPRVNVSGQDVAIGQAVSITGSVKNTVNTSAGMHSWHMDMKKYAPGVAVPTGGATTNSSQYACGGSDCTQNYAGEYNDSFGGNATKSAGPSGAGATYTIASPKDPHNTRNDPIGTSYCYWTSVQTPTPSDGVKWAHSAPACFTVGVYPSVQFLGYDVRAGGLAVAHPFTIGNGTYGSWGEFGVFSRGANTGFASGAGLAGHQGNSSSSQQDWSSLTFANCKVAGRTCPVNNYFGRFGNTVTYPSDIVAGLVNMCNSSNTVPDGTTIPANSNISGTKYICSNGTVTIGGDQTYASANTSDSSLPQQVIIAKGIKIASGVQTVNSWLVATGATISDAQKGSAQGGVINTCSDATAATKLTTNICSKQLAVVGPVITKELDLLRTYYKTNGSTYDPAVPAETFNLRSDAFLWAYQGNGGGTPMAQTTSVTDLPPRF